jgi:hypothetical protein
MLSSGIILIGGKFEIVSGCHNIYWNTFAIRKTEAIRILAVGMILIGRKLEIVSGTGRIDRNSLSCLKTATVRILGRGVTLIGGEFEIVGRTDQVYRDTAPILETEAVAILTLRDIVISRNSEISRSQRIAIRLRTVSAHLGKRSHLNFEIVPIKRGSCFFRGGHLARFSFPSA